MIYDRLVALLTDATAAGSRVHPQIAPDGVDKPYIVYSRISANSENVLDGATGLWNTRVQIDVFSTSYVEAQAIAAAVDTLMAGWSVQNVSNPQIDQFESETKLHRVILDYSIWHD